MPTRIEDVPPELIVDFDVTDPNLAIAHDRLAEIREKTPICYSPAHGGYWMLTRYEDCHEAVRDWETFSNERNQIPVVMPQRSIPLEYDPPEHTMYRRVLNPLFNPRRMNALEGQIRKSATELIDAFVDRGSCDFVTEFAHPLTMTTFSTLMGWPLSDGAKFSKWTHDILVGKPGASPEEDMAVRGQANQEVFEYFGKVIADRKGKPVDEDKDPTGAIVNGMFGDRPMSDEELLLMLWLVMLGGLHTVRGVLAFGMVHLAENPDQRQLLLDDPSKIAEAAEEVMRLDAPVATARVVKKAVTFKGVQMQEGDMVLVSLPASGRDPAKFEAPHEMRIGRQPNPQLAFSAGPHRCVGSHLARIELRVALEEIHRRIPDYRLDPDKPAQYHHNQVRGVDSLPILFTPESAR